MSTQELVISTTSLIRKSETNIDVKRRLLSIILSPIISSFQVSEEDLIAPTRCKAEIARARQIAMYIAHVSLGLSLTKVGSLFGRDRTTAAHACRVIEDLRDDPNFDRAMDCLEASLYPFMERRSHLV